MKKNQSAIVFGAIGLFAGSFLLAQNYQQMPVGSGYNADVIANGVGSSSVSTNNDVDGVSFAFISKGFQVNNLAIPLPTGLPTDGIINSSITSTPGLTYQLGNYSTNNVLRLLTNDSGTLIFSTPKAASKLYMLATTGSAGSVANTLSITVNFTDNTSEVLPNVTVADWYGGTNFAIQGINRINRTNDNVEAVTDNPRLYQYELAISAGNQSKQIQSVTISKTAGTGTGNIFAFSAEAYSDCTPPVITATTGITVNSANVNWNASSSAQATNYGVYYSTSPIPPTAGTPAILNNISGTTALLSNLPANTVHYFWVKTNCSTSSGQSAWSFAGNFRTSCGPMTSLSENFDSYVTGNNLPECWVRNYVNGTMSISATTPVASGTRHIYQLNSTTQTPSTVVLPEFSNINAGTHWLRLKARVSAATGTLNVGYVTNPTDASTFVLLQALSISNTVYAFTNSEFKVSIPSTVPAGARLAIRNTADGKGYYWDDVIWEAVSSCLPPSDVVTSAASSNSVNVSYTAPSSGSANGYEYYYSAVSTVTPTSSTIASGTFATNSTSGIITGLNPNHSYNLWMRSVCSASDKSEWTYQKSFRTLCAPAPSLFEDFESYTATAVVPDCWVRLMGTTGTQSINATTPASGIRQMYQVSTSSQATSVVVLPELSNINSGTHRLRFKAKISSATGSLNVGYVTDVNDASSFVSVQVVSVGNTTYNALSEFAVYIPAGIPATARLAFRNTADGKSYYWDDLYWEPSGILSASEVPAVKKKLTLYPNPFKDVIYISETKDIKSVTVYDVAGRIVKLVNDASKEIHLNELKEGMYLVKISFKDGTQTVTKAIKK